MTAETVDDLEGRTFKMFMCSIHIWEASGRSRREVYMIGLTSLLKNHSSPPARSGDPQKSDPDNRSIHPERRL